MSGLGGRLNLLQAGFALGLRFWNTDSSDGLMCIGLSTLFINYSKSTTSKKPALNLFISSVSPEQKSL